MAAYDCLKCPGYCCSYPVIALTKRDVERLAKHLGISAAEAEQVNGEQDFLDLVELAIGRFGD